MKDPTYINSDMSLSFDTSNILSQSTFDTNNYESEKLDDHNFGKQSLSQETERLNSSVTEEILSDSQQKNQNHSKETVILNDVNDDDENDDFIFVYSKCDYNSDQRLQKPFFDKNSSESSRQSQITILPFSNDENNNSQGANVIVDDESNYFNQI